MLLTGYDASFIGPNMTTNNGITDKVYYLQLSYIYIEYMEPTSRVYCKCWCEQAACVYAHCVAQRGVVVAYDPVIAG